MELLDDDGKPRRVAFADAYPEVAGQRSSIVASLQARGQTFGSIRLTTSGSLQAPQASIHEPAQVDQQCAPTPARLAFRSQAPPILL